MTCNTHDVCTLLIQISRLAVIGDNRHKQHGEEDHLGVFGASGEEDHLGVFGASGEEDYLGVFGASGATETQLVREGWVEVCRGTGKGSVLSY